MTRAWNTAGALANIDQIVIVARQSLSPLSLFKSDQVVSATKIHLSELGAFKRSKAVDILRKE